MPTMERTQVGEEAGRLSAQAPECLVAGGSTEAWDGLFPFEVSMLSFTQKFFPKAV